MSANAWLHFEKWNQFVKMMLSYRNIITIKHVDEQSTDKVSEQSHSIHIEHANIYAQSVYLSDNCLASLRGSIENIDPSKLASTDVVTPSMVTNPVTSSSKFASIAVAHFNERTVNPGNPCGGLILGLLIVGLLLRRK
uniref:Uncharacterized protein n=1 Tax=Nephroselmis olivacea TaxID=31312 RepID=Q9TKW0_NEPOL|nr:hypothetical protein NeolCp080 [Nephroselmis olivacea]AAD54856.1 unknown [Nephroselmis olivacea]